MTRVNIILPEELHKKIKVMCAVEGSTIKEYIKEVLDKKINSKSKTGSE
ncbi:hypothetical protein KY308_00120 [Candidatus Woesearchaeota archaeon]|nr:hypothetical protein [Candidatus Woesearchaeota archaeon]